MNIVAIAGAHVRQSGAVQLFIGHGYIPLRGQFDVIRQARYQPNRHVCPFGDRRVVGEIGPAGR